MSRACIHAVCGTHAIYVGGLKKHVNVNVPFPPNACKLCISCSHKVLMKAKELIHDACVRNLYTLHRNLFHHHAFLNKYTVDKVEVMDMYMCI